MQSICNRRNDNESLVLLSSTIHTKLIAALLCTVQSHTLLLKHHVLCCEHVCYKVIAQDESALPLTSTGPGSTNLSTVQWNGLRGGVVMLPHV